MGEGFGNALSGMITQDPFYRDSSQAQQSRGFSINVETNDSSGWFDESTVQAILYDLFDSPADGNDNLALGLGPIYETFTAQSYIEQPTFTSIFSFLAELRSQQANSAAAIDAFAASRGINVTNARAIGETNPGTFQDEPIVYELPVYKQVTVNGGPVEVCSVNNAGEFNKLGNRDYVIFTATAGLHTLTMTRTSGASSRDPDFIIFRNGNLVARAESGEADTETTNVNLAAGEHVIDTYDFINLGLGGGNTADSCYDFQITR